MVTVSSKRFADALVLTGSLCIAEVRLSFHPTLASAELAASRLPLPSPTNRSSVRTLSEAFTVPSTASPNNFITVDSPSVASLEDIRLGTVPRDLLRALPLPCLALPGSEGVAPCLVATAAIATRGVNAQRPRSYLEAALSPPVPKPPSVTTRKVLDPAKGCFRCLASNHRVAACRDPVRCRRCWASGHRSSRCKMKLGGILRAAARRLRTPAAARAARARSAPQGSNVSAPLLRAEDPAPTLDLNELPTTDFSFLCQEAYLPNNMVPSSSSGPSQPEVLGSERFEQPPLEQPCIDKFVSESPRLAPMGTLGTTPASSTPLLDAPGSAGLASLPVQAAPTLTASSAEEYASGELDSGSDSSRSSWQGGRPRHAEAWVSPGRASLNERLLFAFIEPPVLMSEVSAFIRDALRTVAPLQPVDLLPSSLGAMLLRCESLAARDCLHRFTPIRLGGSLLHLQKPEETPNRFFRVPVWLAFVFVIGFPNEHWYEEKIRDCFRGFPEIAEIDPECLTGENFGPLRLLLELNDHSELPVELRIASRSGAGRFGAVARIVPIRVWPREFQLDSRGNLASFFGPPEPPSGGPLLGPMGPSSGQ